MDDNGERSLEKRDGTRQDGTDRPDDTPCQQDWYFTFTGLSTFPSFVPEDHTLFPSTTDYRLSATWRLILPVTATATACAFVDGRVSRLVDRR